MLRRFTAEHRRWPGATRRRTCANRRGKGRAWPPTPPEKREQKGRYVRISGPPPPPIQLGDRDRHAANITHDSKGSVRPWREIAQRISRVGTSMTESRRRHPREAQKGNARCLFQFTSHGFAVENPDQQQTSHDARLSQDGLLEISQAARQMANTGGDPLSGEKRQESSFPHQGDIVSVCRRAIQHRSPLRRASPSAGEGGGFPQFAESCIAQKIRTHSWKREPRQLQHVRPRSIENIAAQSKQAKGILSQ